MKDRFIVNLKNITGEICNLRFLLAVSGGLDSCVLAHLFFIHEIPFDIAHCNFHLRGTDSDLDEQFVTNLVNRYDARLYSKEFDTFEIQKNSGKSIEMVARELRYNWFAEIGESYDFIVTAHHANDNAETLLLNLTRGTGLKGLTGIPERNGKIIRPLLPFTSSEIEDYALQHKIAFREDSTNASEAYSRNKIRLSVIPKLEEINPELIGTFSNNIAVFKKQYAFYRNQISSLAKELLIRENRNYSIFMDKLNAFPHPDLILYEILKDYNFNASVCDDIFRNIDAEPGKQFYSKTHKILKDREKLIISEISSEDTKTAVLLSAEEDFEKLGFSIEINEYQPDMHFEKDKNCLYADAAKLTFPLVLRNWEKGDFFYPFGMKGRKKISDFFTDLKINLDKKSQIKLLCHQDNIVWIVGYRADDRYRIDPETTKNYYLIRYHHEYL